MGIGAIEIIGGEAVELEFGPILDLGDACAQILQTDDFRVLADQPVEQAAGGGLKNPVAG